MSKKKKKSSAAENLIESLMDDLKDIQGESSYRSTSDEDNFAGLPTLDDEAHRIENTQANELWANIENGLDKELVSSEFSGASDSDQDSDMTEMPEGFESLPPSERFKVGLKEEESVFKGPSVDAVYQSVDEVFAAPPAAPVAEDDATRPLMAGSSSASGEDKTISIQQELNQTSSALAGSGATGTDADKTIAVSGFANARLGVRKSSDVDVKVSVGGYRGGGRGAANVMTSVDASLAQAENLKIAQQRILELEKEVEVLRAENEELASAGEIIRSRADDLMVRVSAVEKEKIEIQESAQSEIIILKGNLQYKESEVAKARIKVEELETRLKSDFKKIRVRERELENRLELLRAEKSALVRSKDEYILEQKRKIDQLSQELDNYRKKCLELNKTIEANQDQVKRTERALRIALSNLETKEESLVPLKKAE